MYKNIYGDGVLIQLANRDNRIIWCELCKYVPSYDPEREPEDIITKIVIVDATTNNILYKASGLHVDYEYVCKKIEDILFLIDVEAQDEKLDKNIEKFVKENIYAINLLLNTDCMYIFNLRKIKRQNKAKQEQQLKEDLIKENQELKIQVDKLLNANDLIVETIDRITYIAHKHYKNSKIDNNILELVVTNEEYKNKYYDSIVIYSFNIDSLLDKNKTYYLWEEFDNIRYKQIIKIIGSLEMNLNRTKINQINL